MAYEPYEWKPKDNITTARLNHIEQGVASGGGGVVMSMILPDNPDDFRLPMTWQEIRDAMASGKQVFLLITDRTNGECIDMVVEVSYEGGVYIVRLFGKMKLEEFTAESPSDYPVYDGK